MLTALPPHYSYFLLGMASTPLDRGTRRGRLVPEEDRGILGGSMVSEGELVPPVEHESSLAGGRPWRSPGLAREDDPAYAPNPAVICEVNNPENSMPPPPPVEGRAPPSRDEDPLLAETFRDGLRVDARWRLRLRRECPTTLFCSCSWNWSNSC